LLADMLAQLTGWRVQAAASGRKWFGWKNQEGILRTYRCSCCPWTEGSRGGRHCYLRLSAHGRHAHR